LLAPLIEGLSSPANFYYAKLWQSAPVLSKADILDCIKQLARPSPTSSMSDAPVVNLDVSAIDIFDWTHRLFHCIYRISAYAAMEIGISGGWGPLLPACSDCRNSFDRQWQQKREDDVYYATDLILDDDGDGSQAGPLSLLLLHSHSTSRIKHLTYKPGETINFSRVYAIQVPCGGEGVSVVAMVAIENNPRRQDYKDYTVVVEGDVVPALDRTSGLRFENTVWRLYRNTPKLKNVIFVQPMQTH